MFWERLKPLGDDKVTNYKRVHHKKFMDDKAYRVLRDVIYEFDSDGTGGEYSGRTRKIRTWIQIFPWETYTFKYTTKHSYVRVGESWFIDQEDFDINKPRNLNLIDMFQAMIADEPHKSKFSKFMEKIFGYEDPMKTWLQEESERVNEILKKGENTTPAGSTDPKDAT